MRSYENDAIVVQYDVKRCIHAAECVRGLPTVFNPQRRPWIDTNGADADDIAAVIACCPTGALHYSRNDGGAAEAVPAEHSVTLEPDGPLVLRGHFQITDQAGHVLLEDTRIALCRCGASQNKPLCDGSHHTIGFAAD
ncbi:MAG: hypothetical protein HC876_09730 [Chloroflexaceae bacterium]|nr:hypothetical protein [Chloroflexaceae bacterium]